jgi:hypothetical protein
MPCQLMVGFFAYAKSLEICVDKKELEGKTSMSIMFIAFCLTRFLFPTMTYWSVHYPELLT